MARYLVTEGFLEADGPLWFVGPEAEKHFGRRHFMGLTAVFTAAPEFIVLHGRQAIGKTDPSLLTASVDGPRLILLGGHTWRVTWVDWKRRRCFVEPHEGGGGRARWVSSGIGGASFAVARAMRDVLLGEDPPVSLSRRAASGLVSVREDNLKTVHPGGTVILRTLSGDLRWWTWAGYRGNATLGSLADESQRVDDLYLRLRGDLTAQKWRSAAPELRDQLCLPEVDDKAVDGLKFSAALPRRLAVAALSAHLADFNGAATVLDEPQRFTIL